jgi:hypothetical protein
MRNLILTIVLLSLFFSACKKEPIPNPLYGEWRLTNWIFEGRDITDSIDVIWGEEEILYFSGKSYSLGARNPIRNNGDWTLGSQIGYYIIKTDDLKYIELELMSANIDTSLAENYKIKKNFFDIMDHNNSEMVLFGKFGLNSFTLKRL